MVANEKTKTTAALVIKLIKNTNLDTIAHIVQSWIHTREAGNQIADLLPRRVGSYPSCPKGRWNMLVVGIVATLAEEDQCLDARAQYFIVNEALVKPVTQFEKWEMAIINNESHLECIIKRGARTEKLYGKEGQRDSNRLGSFYFRIGTHQQDEVAQ